MALLWGKYYYCYCLTCKETKFWRGHRTSGVTRILTLTWRFWQPTSLALVSDSVTRCHHASVQITQYQRSSVLKQVINWNCPLTSSLLCEIHAGRTTGGFWGALLPNVLLRVTQPMDGHRDGCLAWMECCRSGLVCSSCNSWAKTKVVMKWFTGHMII